MVKMMITVVVIYAICWLPIHTITLVGDRHPHIYTYQHIQTIWICCHWLAMSNGCYNPIVYCWMNTKFRQGFRHIFRCCPFVKYDPSAADGRTGTMGMAGGTASASGTVGSNAYSKTSVVLHSCSRLSNTSNSPTPLAELCENKRLSPYMAARNGDKKTIYRGSYGDHDVGAGNGVCGGGGNKDCQRCSYVDGEDGIRLYQFSGRNPASSVITSSVKIILNDAF